MLHIKRGLVMDSLILMIIIYAVAFFIGGLIVYFVMRGSNKKELEKQSVVSTGKDNGIELKKLKEELEDCKDDLEDAEVKIKKREQEKLDLQNKLDEKTKICENQISEIEKLSGDYKESSEKLNVCNKSLNFVSEILNAEKSVVQNKKIDNLKAFVEGQFTDLVHYLGANKEWAGYKSCGENLLRSFGEWAVKKEKVWLDGKTTIAFLGEFSAGKTSIVNRIYSQDNKNVPKLPVSTEATTAIPTYIAGGNSFSYTFVTPSDERKKLKPETFNLVSKRILDNIKGTSSLIKYFVMTCDNPNLANFSILDTPGFSSNDKEDEYRTTDVIRESDALFWVFDVNNGTVNRKSIEILKKESQLPPLYVVINKIDTKAEVEVQKVESLIKKTLADEGLNVKGYIRFSSQAPLENIMRVVKSISPQQNESYLLDMDNYLKGILNDVETIKRDMENRSKDARDVVARNNTSFDEKLQKTASDIESLENYFHPKDAFWFWSEDRYQVSKQGFNVFKSKLREISNFVEETLRNNIKTYGDNVAASEDRMKSLQGIRDVYNRVRDCVDSFNRVKNI